MHATNPEPPLTLVTPEFRRHRKVDNPLHIIAFLTEWKLYLDQLPKDEGSVNFSGRKLDPMLIEKVRRACACFASAGG